jgi:hypothetical protein
MMRTNPLGLFLIVSIFIFSGSALAIHIPFTEGEKQTVRDIDARIAQRKIEDQLTPIEECKSWCKIESCRQACEIKFSLFRIEGILKEGKK